MQHSAALSAHNNVSPAASDHIQYQRTSPSDANNCSGTQTLPRFITVSQTAVTSPWFQQSSEYEIPCSTT